MNLFPDNFETIGRNSALGSFGALTTAELAQKIPEVIQWFQQTPGANPSPDIAALEFYANAGRDAFDRDVAAFRAANPEAAKQIDLLRGRLNLPGGVKPAPDTLPPPSIIVADKPVVVAPPTPIVDCAPGYRYDPNVRECVAIPGYVTPPKPVFTGPTIVELQPIYTKEYPYPTAESDIFGYLYGQDELDKPIRRPFNLKKGDPIPVNWQAELPMTSPGEPARPTTPAAAGTGTLLLAAIAAYLIGG